MILVGALLLLVPADATTTANWEQWEHLPGVLDLAGPLPDGTLVAVAGGQLKSLHREGTASSYSGQFATAGSESYLAASSGRQVESAGCTFALEDLFWLRLSPPLGIVRVDRQGTVWPFAEFPGVESLSGIVSDGVGRFGYRLLVTGVHLGKTVLEAFDCQGKSTLITSSAPLLEGGLAVAPSTFGDYAGQLIAPDENSGAILALSPAGGWTVIADSGIPKGGDIGVESAGFVPPGFAAGGWAYLADRGTPGNPHPGTDSVLRLSSRDLSRAGVQDGDLLVAGEGGGVTVDIRCTSACSVHEVAVGPPSGHIEGHLLAIADHPGQATAAAGANSPAWPVPVLALLLVLAAGYYLLRLRRRRISGAPGTAPPAARSAAGPRS